MASSGATVWPSMHATRLADVRELVAGGDDDAAPTDHRPGPFLGRFGGLSHSGAHCKATSGAGLGLVAGDELSDSVVRFRMKLAKRLKVTVSTCSSTVSAGGAPLTRRYAPRSKRFTRGCRRNHGSWAALNLRA